MAVAPARRVALKLVGECRRRSARMRDLLRASQELDALDVRDRTLAFRLAMGVAAAQGLLDSIIDAHLNKPRSLEPKVRDALRVSAFEILWMQTPHRVAVSQGVELVRLASSRAAGLANAVLRRIASEDADHMSEAHDRCANGTGSIDDLALVAAMPTWLVDELVRSRGLEAATQLLVTRLLRAHTLVGTNLARHTIDETFDLLEGAGLMPVKSSLPGAFELGNLAGFGASGLIDDGSVVVSDAAAQLVCQLVRPKPGSHVLEIGQGRATKTILLESVSLSQGGCCQMVSIDSEAFKVKLSKKRLREAGLSDVVSCLCLDGRRLAEKDLPGDLNREFDLVFLDAPCSGVGTMRRHVEIPWSLRREAVDGSLPTSLPALQLELIKAAATRVKTNGTLCYSTCSALVQEDEEVVEAFLASQEGREFRLVSALSRLGDDDTSALLARLVSPWVDEKGYLLTGQSKTSLGLVDTHFLAILERKD